MSKTLVTKELSDALVDVKSRIREGLVTANRKDVPEETRTIIAEAYKKFARSMHSIAEKLNVTSYGLHLKMGRYAPNGKYKSHLWCAIIPQSVKAPSNYTTQLYVFRSENALSWGISPSDIAQKNDDFMKVYRQALLENRDMVKSLFDQGFVCRVDSEKHGDRHEKVYATDLKSFFDSSNNIIARVFLTNSLPSENEIESMIESDLKKMMPLYLKVVESCMRNNLLQRLNPAEEDAEVEVVSENKLVKLKTLIDGNLSQQKPIKQFSVDDALKEVFIQKDDFLSMIEAIKYKKNIILQGPPGVGKTFSAKRIAYSLIGQDDESRIGFVQFHPSYSYEDFVQGIRPVDGKFQLKNGLFMDFCNEARKSEKPFVVIIDEINRGNLAKIFGELLFLIEADKRKEKVRLAYSQNGEEFSIPENLFIIGTMNTADRSLSMVDYALRRRFMFFNMKPEFSSQGFIETLKDMTLTDDNIRFIQEKLSQLNSVIVNDRRNLGPGFEIGHSYFSRKPTDMSFDKWFAGIVKMEIEPLLKEYWYDDAEKVIEITKTLKVA